MAWSGTWYVTGLSHQWLVTGLGSWEVRLGQHGVDQGEVAGGAPAPPAHLQPEGGAQDRIHISGHMAHPMAITTSTFHIYQLLNIYTFVFYGGGGGGW